LIQPIEVRKDSGREKVNSRIFEKLHSLYLRRISKPLGIAISALFIISMIAIIATQPAAAATTTVGSLAGGKWIATAHTNVEPITTYNIPHTETGLSASGVTNIDNLKLPKEIFRGYTNWDAQGGAWNLQSTPILALTFGATK
jgi:hypothetical protein